MTENKCLNFDLHCYFVTIFLQQAQCNVSFILDIVGKSTKQVI